MPQVLGMVKNPHYLYRMTVLVAISSLANYVSQEVFVSTMLPVLVQCAKDRVPNVKFNVAKVRGHTEVLYGALVDHVPRRQAADTCFCCHLCSTRHNTICVCAMWLCCCAGTGAGGAPC